MQITILALWLLASIPFTLAQSLAGLPPCAVSYPLLYNIQILTGPPPQQNCALSAISGSGCPVTNITCICESPTFISSYTDCVGTSCNATEAAGKFLHTKMTLSSNLLMRAAAAQFGIQYCAAAGVTISPSAPAAPATSALATSAPASTEASATTAASPAPSATAVTTLSDGQPESPTSVTPAVSTFTGAAQPLILHNVGSWMLAVLGLTGGLVAVEL